MTNEIAKNGPNYFEKYGEAATQRAIVGRLLKFTKFGEYVAGQENELIAVGTELIAYMPSLTVGYVRWEDNAPAQYEIGYVKDGFVPPRRNDLGYNDAGEWNTDDRGNPRDPWQFTNSLIFIDIESRLLYTFNTASKGGLGAMGGLSKVYGRHMKEKPRDLPTVKLGVSSYRHTRKEFGEIRVPLFTIVTNKWVPVDDLPPLDGLPSFVETKHIETTMKEDMGGDGIPF